MYRGTNPKNFWWYRWTNDDKYRGELNVAERNFSKFLQEAASLPDAKTAEERHARRAAYNAAKRKVNLAKKRHLKSLAALACAGEWMRANPPTGEQR